jgi:glycosyltransferase
MKISVITAVYNNRDTIAQALDSALAQDHPNVELIVIDGGSTESTTVGIGDGLLALMRKD